MAFTPDAKLRDFVGSGTKVPVTASLRLDDARRSLATGRISGTLEIYDGYTTDFVEIDGQRVPLEVEPSAAFAYTLSESAIWDWELRGFLVGDLVKGLVVATKAGEARAQLLFMQPYRRNRIPVVFVHGTASGPGRWADMLNSLENDPWLRTRFQYWFFYYDTGNPITYSADVLRTSLRLIIHQLDPDRTDEALRANGSHRAQPGRTAHQDDGHRFGDQALGYNKPTAARRPHASGRDAGAAPAYSFPSATSIRAPPCLHRYSAPRQL